jgi:hypothetical protein
MDHFKRYVMRGACWMAKVCAKNGKNVITRLAFLGCEDDPCELNWQLQYWGSDIVQFLSWV